MKYMVFAILYLISYVVISIQLWRKNRIDTFDYWNRKSEVRGQTLNMLGNYILVMLFFNLISAVIYKLLTLRFLTFRCLIAIFFHSFVQTTFITLFYPKIIFLDVCWIERLMIMFIPLFIFIFCVQQHML